MVSCECGNWTLNGKSCMFTQYSGLEHCSTQPAYFDGLLVVGIITVVIFFILVYCVWCYKKLDSSNTDSKNKGIDNNG